MGIEEVLSAVREVLHDSWQPQIDWRLWARKAKAEQALDEGSYSHRCVINGEAIFFHEGSSALVEGHCYSGDGVKEAELRGICEYHFDEATAEPEEEPIHLALGRLSTIEHELCQVDSLAGDSEEPEAWESDRTSTQDLTTANTISSRIFGLDHWHAPVLDIDLPCHLEPSSTPGHFHLFIDKPMPWSAYVKVLEVLAEAGILQRGYADASIERGATYVRLPWVRKP